MIHNEETIEQLIDKYRDSWRQSPTTVEDFLSQSSLPQEASGQLTVRLIKHEIELRRSSGESCSASDYQKRFPDRSISFKGTLQTLEAFQPVLAMRNRCDPMFRRELYQQLLDCIAAHRVANRPDRFEPRKRKRRFKLYNFLRKSRQETKLDMMKRVRKN